MRHRIWFPVGTMILSVLVLVSGCGSGNSGSSDGDISYDGDAGGYPDYDGDAHTDGDAADGDTGYPDFDGDYSPDGDLSYDGDVAADGDTAIDGDEYYGDSESPGDGDYVPDGDSPGVDGDGVDESVDQPEDAPEPGQLTAGEWNDLDHWEFWLNLFQDSQWDRMLAWWGFHPFNRFSLLVTADGSPVTDAQALLLDPNGVVLYRARTNIHGQAELFAGLDGSELPTSFEILVSKNDESARFSLDSPGGAESIPVELTATGQTDQILDLMFVIDSTGSMGDELRYLQSELSDVIRQVKQEAGGNLRVRVSANVYRDHGDSYVVRPQPFSEDIDEVLDWLGGQSADGGNDFEESVEHALDDGINRHAWSGSAVARLLFLVLDAPPHHETTIIEEMRTHAIAAADKGIRIIPVTASGINKETEFLMRFVDIATGGTYVFLTDDSGIGGGHLPAEPTIGPHEVERLNSLLVRLITEAVGG